MTVSSGESMCRMVAMLIHTLAHVRGLFQLSAARSVRLRERVHVLMSLFVVAAVARDFVLIDSSLCEKKDKPNNGSRWRLGRREALDCNRLSFSFGLFF